MTLDYTIPVAPKVVIEWFGFWIAAIALGTAVGKVGRWAKKTYDRMRTETAERDERGRLILGNVERLVADVEKVTYEVQYNGNHSLKDGVRALATTVTLEQAARRIGDTRAVWEGRVVGDRVVPSHASEAFTHITGLTIADTAHGGWTRCVHPDDRDRVVLEADRAGEQGLVFQANYRAVNIVTQVMTSVRHLVMPIQAADGVIVGWVGLIVPVPAVPDIQTRSAA